MCCFFISFFQIPFLFFVFKLKNHQYRQCLEYNSEQHLYRKENNFSQSKHNIFFCPCKQEKLYEEGKILRSWKVCVMNL